MIIAVDGPAAAGKGTLARRLAAHLGFAYLDTGALYRAVALARIRAGGNLHDEVAAEQAAATLDPSTLRDPALRSESTGEAASIVAAMPQVRANLLEFQRKFAASPPGDVGGAVIDGRDIGTIVCPHADVKLFVTASPEERARRRLLELADSSDALAYDQLLADIKARDARDQSRTTSPLRQAEDALLLDTTKLDIEAAFSQALALVNQTLGPV